MQAQINNTDIATVQKMERIISACRDYSLLNVDKIDSMAKSAATASGIGIAVGASGTIVSAAANSDKIRSDNTDSSMAKEKKSEHRKQCPGGRCHNNQRRCNHI